jgi:hypothetical protein
MSAWSSLTKQRLNNAIRELFNNIRDPDFHIRNFHIELIIDNLGDDDKFILDEDQIQQLAQHTIRRVVVVMIKICNMFTVACVLKH